VTETFPTPRDAATVILLRSRGAAYEVFLLRRRKGSSFMGGAFVFPGGAAEPGDRDLRESGARELFEEAGVLLTETPVPVEQLAAWRKRILAGEPLAPILADAGVTFALDALRYHSHWITPSVEKKRFSARFYVAVLPEGQTPSFDDQETVDEAWVTPAEAVERVVELQLPPPQLRTFLELRERATIDDVLALCARRAAHPHPVMPRLAPQPAGFALLLPWDPEYTSAGTGDLHPMPADHPLAEGPSRFVMEDRAWRHTHAPGSTTAG
jgi:8-oxo-dGTP pyrophosphatase MutT (NUDIX family)